MKNKALMLLISLFPLLTLPGSAAGERSAVEFPALAEMNGETIVSREARISEAAALLALARILAAQEESWGEARHIFRSLLSEHPDDPEILAGMADLLLAQGDAAQAREIFLRFQARDADPETRLAYADRMVFWGDFYGAEQIYRDHLKRVGQERRVLLRLADLLLAMQRSEEAEGIYQGLLLWESEAADVLLRMARLKAFEKAYPAAEGWALRAVAADPGQDDARLLRGDVLASLGRREEARQVYDALIPGRLGARAALGIGKTFLREGNTAEAQRIFAAAAAAHPEDVEALFHAAGPAGRESAGFIADLLGREKRPSRLVQWARLYAAAGLRDRAVDLYEAALAIDGGHFPARIELAEMLALEGQYDRSLALYKALADQFPAAAKILLGQARVLAWSKRYPEALAHYERLQRLNPKDPIPLREMARTAFWGKRYDDGLAAYDRLLSPPVDRLLLADMTAAAAATDSDDLRRAVRTLEEQVAQGGGINGYEAFREAFGTLRTGLPREESLSIETVLAVHHPQWRLQRAVALEKRAKELQWRRRPTRAAALLKELLIVEPGNQEARFDLAQVLCSLGLCAAEGDVYRDLLAIDPQHSLAGKALRRQQIRSSPAVKFAGEIWRERGRGELARIERFREEAAFDLPLDGRYRFTVKALHWIERPERDGKSYGAYGPSLGLHGLLTPALRGEAGWTLKTYRDGALGQRHSGYGSLWLNHRDAVLFGAGFRRTDEIANLFGLRQGIQSDAWWVSARSEITRQLEASAAARWLEFSDGNGGQHHSLSLGYAFSEHPRVFKVILSGDYRDTRETERHLFQGTDLRDIIHPYWTPQAYRAGAVTFEWRHDLAEDFFCGARPHHYDIRVGFGTDSERNASARIEAEWLYGLTEAWTAGIRASVHRSRDWNAEGLQALLSWHF
jgi:tetratricopeptide (TPR) repeat protein